jgi:PncC family amidohydrolase
MDDNIQATAARLVRRLKKDNRTITVAESCTGGLLASTLTDIAGASQWFSKSWVTYANEAKIGELGVEEEVLTSKGAVSARVAIQMARGARERANADIAIAITGIAGPGNDGTTKPIGTVYVGIASSTWANALHTQIGGTRAENKSGFVHFALRTAIHCWDDAMAQEAKAEVEKQVAIEQAIQEEKDREIELERREAAARETAPWQDEAWEGDGQPPSSEMGIDIEWSEEE